MGPPGRVESGRRIREGKIHGPSNGTCASEAAPAVHVEINHCQRKKIKGTGTQVLSYEKRRAEGDFFPGLLQSWASDLPGVPETIPSPDPEGLASWARNLCSDTELCT